MRSHSVGAGGEAPLPGTCRLTEAFVKLGPQALLPGNSGGGAPGQTPGPQPRRAQDPQCCAWGGRAFGSPGLQGRGDASPERPGLQGHPHALDGFMPGKEWGGGDALTQLIHSQCERQVRLPSQKLLTEGRGRAWVEETPARRGRPMANTGEWVCAQGPLRPRAAPRAAPRAVPTGDPGMWGPGTLHRAEQVSTC